MMAVTCSPHDFRMVPTLLAMMPLPIPEMTPPVTRMYFIMATPVAVETNIKADANRRCEIKDQETETESESRIRVRGFR